MKKLVPLSQLIENVEDPEQVLINPREIYQVNPEPTTEELMASNPSLDETDDNPFDDQD